MVEQILSDIYRIEIPLPQSPLKALNAYLIKGGERFLMIDTGWNRQECLDSMLSGLEELKVDLNKTDFFITHLHADHMGLIGKLIGKTSRVYLGKVEASVVASIRKRPEERYAQLFNMYLTYGFPEAELRSVMEKHPGLRYGPSTPVAFCTLRDGEKIEAGNYTFRCIETPGHSPGHMCLYEERAKILISGDHILFDITPNITRWPELENSLGEYLTSLEKVNTLDVELVLPGHRFIMNNHRERIKELQEHHKRRLDEVLGYRCSFLGKFSSCPEMVRFGRNHGSPSIPHTLRNRCLQKTQKQNALFVATRGRGTPLNNSITGLKTLRP